jgi:hypothetical protein
MLTVVNGMQTARAGDDDSDDGPGDDVRVLCQNDDGDDDLPSNEEPVDDPDSEDGGLEPGAAEVIIIGGPEVGDPEDDDPYYEDDDCPTPTPFGFCGNMTAQGVYLFADQDYQGVCFHTNEDLAFVNEYNDTFSSAKLVDLPSGVELCLHAVWAGNCELVTTDLPDLSVLPNQDCNPTPTPACNLDNNVSSIRFPVVPPAVPGDDVGGSEASFAAADADCDGGVGVGDALANLWYLSGFEAGCVGEPNGGGLQGDADCSGTIAAGDVTAILSAVAAGTDPDC